MNIRIRAFADFRNDLGAETELSVAEGTTVRNLLLRLAEDRRGFAKRIFDPEGELSEDVELLIQGRNVRFLGGLETVLREGDCLFFFPHLSGG